MLGATASIGATHELVPKRRIIHLHNIGGPGLVSDVRVDLQLVACRAGSFLPHILALLFRSDCNWNGHHSRKSFEYQHGRALENPSVVVCRSVDLLSFCGSTVDFLSFGAERPFGARLENLLVELSHQQR
jgi:hypothetical protein